jgi:hypothetical protein
MTQTHSKNILVMESLDTLLTGCQNGHLRELINDHKYIVVAMFC